MKILEFILHMMIAGLVTLIALSYITAAIDGVLQ